MRHLLSLSLLTVIFLAVRPAQAQLPLVDITLVDMGNNEYEVRARPDGFFDEFLSQISFTMRWETASGASLGNVMQVLPEIQYIPIIKSGDEVDTLGYRYQVFFGGSLTVMNTIGVSWNGGEEVTLMTISMVNGTSFLEIVNDDWTGDVMNNGDYYISLNGIDRTGVIYLSPTSVQEVGSTVPSIQVVPNPTNGLARLTVTMPGEATTRIELTDVTGHMVLTQQLNTTNGSVSTDLDLSELASGVYMLHVHTEGKSFTQRVVKR